MGVNSERHMNISWEMLNVPYLGDLEGYLVKNSEWVWTRGVRWIFPGKLPIGPRLRDMVGFLVRDYRWPLAWWCAPIFGWKFWMSLGLVILKEFGLETAMVRWSGNKMDFWLGVQHKDVSLSTRRVQSRVMCGLGVLVGLVVGRLLRGVKTNVAGSFLPRRLY